MKKEKLLEKIAEHEHKQWIHWTSYMLANLTTENIKRWREQIRTPYSVLTEGEKESDRRWARDVMEIVSDHVSKVIFGAEV